MTLLKRRLLCTLAAEDVVNNEIPIATILKAFADKNPFAICNGLAALDSAGLIASVWSGGQLSAYYITPAGRAALISERSVL